MSACLQQRPSYNVIVSKNPAICCLLILMAWGGAMTSSAVVLWSDLSATLVYQTGVGTDILGGAVKRDDTSKDTLYFKFHVDPLSDTSTEEYFAAFELYDRDEERLGVGNALEAWAYSAFNVYKPGYIDLHSSRPEASGHGTFLDYENPHRGLESTIIFKVDYVPGGDDLVTVWLNPDLGPGATEAAQPETLITRFSANASFDEIHLRHGGGGGGWVFSDMEIATSFSDFVTSGSDESNGAISRLGRGERPVTFHSWQREQGLPQNSVRALAQTGDGYLWVGNDDGVARFDGARFVSFGLREGLSSGPVQTLLGDKAGALWIGTTGGGLTCWNGEKFVTFTTRDGLPADSITALAEDKEGRLWVGTEAGLVAWGGGHQSPLIGAGEFKGKTITALFKDGDGAMWMGVLGAGVFQFKDGHFVPVKYPAVEGLLQDPHCLLVDRRSRVWIGVGDDFVLCRDGTQWQPYRMPSHQSKLRINSLVEGPDGAVWAGSASEGLFQFKDGKIQSINANSGLSDNLIESLLVDREGCLWVGTHGGLNRLHSRNLFAFGQKEGLGYGAVQSLAEIAPGVIWAGKRSDGLYVSEGGNFRHFSALGLSLAGPQVSSLLVAKDGSCWMAGSRGLLHFKDPRSGLNDAESLAEINRFRENMETWPRSARNEAELFSDIHATALAEDREGAILVGTREGEVWRRWKENWMGESNYCQSHPITVIGQDREGAMWVGSDGGGLDRFRGNQRVHFDKQNGLLSDLIRTLYVDERGLVWIGTAGGGLSRWQDGQISTFTTREGLPDNTVSQILEDPDGRLWLGTSRGIVCVSKNELKDLAAGKIPGVYPLVYGRTEGMLSEECTGGFSPAGLKAKSGLLWFTTLKGVVAVDPRPLTAEEAPPKVMIEEMLVDGVPDPRFRVLAPTGGQLAGVKNPKEGSEAFQIPPGKHLLEFRYTGVSFDSPERVRFRYRLDPLDNDWLEAGTRRSALYNYVPPGPYTFHVAACNADGTWVETGTVLALTILPHFWQVWWVRLLAALGILISVAGAVLVVEKRKSQRRLQRLEEEKTLEKERTRIAQDLHDDMGAKLCRISYLAEDARRSPELSSGLQRQIGSISDSSREVLSSLDNIVWAINPLNDMLENVVSYIGHYAREYFQETGLECELDMPARSPAYPLSSHLRHHLLLAMHEAFTNVLKHSEATRARISVVCEDTTLEIVISDNGKGFVLPPTGSKAADALSALGNGLRNMRQRLTEIGGDCSIKSKSGVGTTIRFVLPLARAGLEKAGT
jgi:ligand-binding sensor domain-containing protein/signal transduction histidine kinase